MFDLGQSLEDIEEAYYSSAYGEDWRLFRDALCAMSDAVPYKYLSFDHARRRSYGYKDRSMLEGIKKLPELSAKLLELVKSHYNSDVRVETVSIRLLEKHCEYINILSELLLAKCLGKEEEALEIYERLRIHSGSFESQFEQYNDNLQRTGWMKQLTLIVAPGEINNANGD